jgi:hypothetical protein
MTLLLHTSSFRKTLPIPVPPVNPALPYQQAQNSTTCSIPLTHEHHTHTHTHTLSLSLIHYSVHHERILQAKLLEGTLCSETKVKILIIITSTTTATTTSLLVDVKKSHVNSSPSLRHQMQQHRDTETERMMISAMNARHH